MTLYSQEIRNVILICSPDNTREIFEKVRKKSLESSTIRWLVIMDEDFRHSLQQILREGTQVAMATHNPNGTYFLSLSEIGTNDLISFKPLGEWTPPVSFDSLQPRNISTPIGSLKNVILTTHNQIPTAGSVNVTQQPHLRIHRLFPSYKSLYDDFRGRRLVVSVVSNIPFFKLLHLDNGTAVPDYGIDFQVIEALGRRLNFTYRILEPSDGRWGGPEGDGTVSGMVGMVARHSAHLAIDEITINEERKSVVDFTRAYYLEATTLVSRAPAKKDSTFAVFQPFTQLVWLILIAMAGIIGPIVYVIKSCCDVIHLAATSSKTWPISKKESRDKDEPPNDKMPTVDTLSKPRQTRGTGKVLESPQHPNKKQNSLQTVAEPLQNETRNPSTECREVLLSYSFNMLRSLVLQGNQIVEHDTPVRIVLVFWYVFCLVIYASYAGTLTAFLTIPSYERPIDSLEDLTRAAKDGYAPGVQAGTSNEYFLKSAKSGLFKTLWDLTDPKRSFPPSGKVGIERVLTQKIVYMSANLNSEIRTSQKGRHRFYLARQTFFPQGYGIACRIGAPYISKFDEVLISMQQAGLVNKWVKDEVLKIQRSNQGQRGGKGQQKVSQALSLNHLKAAFFLLLVGHIISAATVLCEIRTRRKKIYLH
ncbi:glutamate receptor ionotropic, delta-2-like [Palaemon carinicauda]|uniref:glutamate receptor ionotropic, delta-2-like n=1 Tax=Palaemon carinicauda TaxID=392227 RepID=UPI0035B61847